MIIFSSIFILIFIVETIQATTVPYDSFRGVPVTDAQLKRYKEKNHLDMCVNEIKPCSRSEGRRVDGSCNNLDHPSIGPAHTPLHRILPADFSLENNRYEPRKASDGSALPPPRHLRTSFLSDGKVPDQTFTQITTFYMEFSSTDFLSSSDTFNHVFHKTDCCLPKGRNDPACTPNIVPSGDPVLRFTSLRCLNLTRPQSFQSVGCVKNNTIPERISLTTNFLDLSPIYGTSVKALNKSRLFEKGLLKYDKEDGRVWPPSDNNVANKCHLNQKPAETRCHDTPNESPNSLITTNLMSIWYWRNHNRIATALHDVNPCWDDQKLFDTARDINIATHAQIFYYELMPSLMGKQNLLKDGVIGNSSNGFRDVYNKKILPQLSLEFIACLRWFHTMQEGTLKMFDRDGNHLRDFPAVNLTFRSGFLSIDNNIDYLTQGIFRQACAKGDYVVDPDMSNRILGPMQDASDVCTNDLTRHRYYGINPYTAYRQWFFGKTYKSFDDLKAVFEPENLERLQNHYKKVANIDLLPGLWLEKHVLGGHIPELLYCIMSEQLRRTVASDRHWYERSNRPNAFTSEQLAEVRKSTISRLLCDVGDKVTNIQPQGFLRANKRQVMHFLIVNRYSANLN